MRPPGDPLPFSAVRTAGWAHSKRPPCAPPSAEHLQRNSAVRAHSAVRVRFLGGLVRAPATATERTNERTNACVARHGESHSICGVRALCWPRLTDAEAAASICLAATSASAAEARRAQPPSESDRSTGQSMRVAGMHEHGGPGCGARPSTAGDLVVHWPMAMHRASLALPRSSTH